MRSVLFECLFFILRHVLFSPSVLVAEENDSGILELTFDLPSSPLLELSPVLLLTFERQLKGGNLDVTFTSPSLQPHTQVMTGPVSILHEWNYTNTLRLLSFPVCVYLRRNTAHITDRKSIRGQRLPEMEDFC